MVAAATERSAAEPFGLVVNGEAGEWAEALEKIVGRQWVETYRVGKDREVLDLVEAGVADAAVLDEGAIEAEPLHLLRDIRRRNQTLLVVLLTRTTVDRRWLEEALRLTAFSVVIKPLRLEELLVQVHRMMMRFDALMRGEAF